MVPALALHLLFRILGTFCKCRVRLSANQGLTDPRLARVYGLAAAGFANVRWMGDYIANSFAEIIALAYRY